MPRLTSAPINPWAALAAEVGKPKLREPVGPGWMTMEEAAKAMGCGTTKAKCVMREALASGRAERFQGTAVGMGGGYAPKVWFRLK